MKSFLSAFAVLAGLLAAAAAEAQVPQPRLTATNPTGARAGTTVEVKITGGTDLDLANRLFFSHAGITAVPLVLPPDRLFPEGKTVPNLFKVTVAADVPPGTYEVRAAGYFGISNARRFVVGEAAEASEKEANNDPAHAGEFPVGSTLNGAADAANFDYFRFAAKKGQRLILECAALRLDSRAQIVLTVIDAEEREVARAVATRFLDPFIDFTPAADGTYLLRVHDLTYRGGDEYYYRLTLSGAPWIDFAFPPVLRAGTENEVTLYGRNLPGGAPADLALDGRPLEKLAVKIAAPADPSTTSAPSETLSRPSDATADYFVYRLSSPDGRSNPFRFMVADEPLVQEAEPNNEDAKSQEVKPPVQIVGRFHPAGDRDGYVFEAKKGDKLWIEVTSQRLGLPTDPAFVLQSVTVNDKGEMSVKDIQESDDQATPLPQMGGNAERRYRMHAEDPGLLFTAPQDGRYRVVVRDLYFSAEGDPRFLYRLAIRPARPDFRLIAFPIENYPAQNRLNPGATVVRRGGAERIRVIAYRREGFDDPIRVEAEGLPPGVTGRPVTIGPGSTSTEFILQAAPDAPPFAGTFRLVGKAEIEGKAVAHAVRSVEIVWIVGDMQRDTLATRVTEGIGLAVDERYVAPLGVQLGGPETYRMSRGGKLAIPVKLVKNADFKDLDKAQVKLAAVGLPGRGNNRPIVAKEVTLTVAKPEGQMEIDITDKAPVGPLTFYVAGDLDAPYQRSVERVKVLEDERKRVEKAAAELAGEIKKAEQARVKAEQELQQAKAALQQAKASGQAEAVLKTAEEKAKEAEEARQNAAEAEQKLREAAKGVEPAKKELADEIKKVSDAAKEKKIKVWVGSTPVTLEVTPYPLTLKGPAEPLVLKPGASGELSIEARREFGFNDEVKFELVGGGSNVRLAAPASLAAGQAEGKASLAAEKNAKAGTYTVTLRAQLKFNNRALTLDHPVTVKIDPAAP